MKPLSIPITISLLVFICKSTSFAQNSNDNLTHGFQRIEHNHYILEKPTKIINAVLILFGGYPQLAADIEREFEVFSAANENNVAIVYSNINGKLWLEENVKELMASHIQGIFEENNLPKDNIIIGGFSSGGTLAMLIGDYLIAHKNFEIAPKGVFLVDSPVDLAVLYEVSEKNVQRNFSEPSVEESSWLLELLGDKIGNPHTDISGYEKLSLFTSQSGYYGNLKNLKNTKIRLYTEPDTLWWKENRRVNYDEMNAFYIKKLAERLTKEGYKHVEYIPTLNKGFRSNGQRHPHSWSIVDPKDLMKWILQN